MKQRTEVLSRRRFLAGAAAAIAAPAIIPASALGAGNTVPPSERIVMGAIGVGGMGRGDMGAFMHSEGVQMVAVCDVDTEYRDSAKKQVEDYYAQKSEKGSTKGCAAYDDFRDLVARDDIDAVTIATPDHWHALISIAAAKSGKDIYCQKPLTLTIAEGQAMVNAVRRYGRVLQTGSQQRSEYHGWFRRACEYVRSGRIGKVLTIHVVCGGPSQDCYLPAQPVPEGLDWDMWLGPAPWRPYNERLHPASWRSYRDYSGGGMTDWGAHHFDIAQWAMGMDNSGPVEIIPPDGKDVKRLTYKYANGVEMYHGGVSIEASGVLFTGTEGKIEVGRTHLTTWPKEIAEEPLAPGEVHLYKSPGHRRDFLNCVRERRRPICDVEIGHRSVTVCHLGNIAYALKRPLKWDPKKEQFVGDAEANRWISRPMRPPWRI
ncbi:MAG: Gfo/Idh/MocA family oxidoreductase [Planctomycetes bacterium]|nr:Gfo/Idh/MocA family oxidoreductase [Planctomycetota bacterium]